MTSINEFVNQRVPSWSTLSIFGNNPIVKLTVLSPILAQVIIHTPRVEFLKPFDFVNLNWLYWSLISFFVAQIIYIFKCPPLVKSYPEQHSFVRTLSDTTSDDQLTAEFYDKYKVYFKQHGGPINIDDVDLHSLKGRIAKNEMKGQREKAPAKLLGAENISRNFVFLIRSIREDKPFPVSYTHLTLPTKA